MTFNSAIPEPGDVLANSQGDIKTNFAQIKAFWEKNHQTITDITATTQGLHKLVQFVNFTSTGITEPYPRSSLYTEDNTTTTRLNFYNGTTKKELTDLTLLGSSTNRGIVTPWGLTINWGNITTAAGTGLGTVTLAQAHTSLPYGVVVCAESDTSTATANRSAVVKTGTIALGSFQVISATGAQVVRFFTIGP